jgi:hypothetical protein
VVVLVTLRVVGLIVNFVANAVLLYGAAGYLGDGSRFPLLVTGGIVTLACILLLAVPRRP